MCTCTNECYQLSDHIQLYTIIKRNLLKHTNNFNVYRKPYENININYTACSAKILLIEISFIFIIVAFEAIYYWVYYQKQLIKFFTQTNYEIDLSVQDTGNVFRSGRPRYRKEKTSNLPKCQAIKADSFWGRNVHLPH